MYRPTTSFNTNIHRGIQQYNQYKLFLEFQLSLLQSQNAINIIEFPLGF